MNQLFENGAAYRQLGGYREWHLKPGYIPHAESVWMHNSGAAAAKHRVLPDAALSIGIRTRRDSVGKLTDANGVFIGANHSYATYAPTKGEELICVRIKPEWTAACVGTLIEDTDGVQPTPSHHVMQRLNNIAEQSAKMDKAEAIWRVVNTVGSLEPRAKSPVVQRAGEIIRRTDGQCSITRLAEHVGASERHLRRLFRQTAGLSPKAYARYMRLNKAAEMFDMVPEAVLSWVAHRCGFVDQAHMTREFQALAGSTPRAIFLERRAEAELYNTGRPG